MGRTRARARAVALTAAITAAFLSVAVQPTASADVDPKPVVTWPSFFQVNPSLTVYTMTIDYDGPSSLFLTKRISAARTFPAQALAPHGSTDIDFPVDYDGQLILNVVACPTDVYVASDCEVVRLPFHAVQVYDEYKPHVGGPDRIGPLTKIPLSVAPFGAGPVHATWDVRPADDPAAAPVLAGDLEITDPDGSDGDLPALGDNDVLVNGQRYLYEVVLESDGPYGHITGGADAEFTWDNAVDVTGMRFDTYDSLLDRSIEDVDVFYPGNDDYLSSWRDELSVRTVPQVHEKLSSYTVTIKNTDDEVVWQDTETDFVPYWSGSDLHQRLVPEGKYQVELAVVDQLGNRAVFTDSASVSYDRLVRATWTQQVSAKESAIDRYVGRCASIKSPARPSWRGSIELRSSDQGRRCRTLQAQSVTSVHALQLPANPFEPNHKLYDRVRVSTYGGGAPGARHPYLVHWYWSRKGEWVGRTQFGKKTEWHDGQLSGSGVVLGKDGEDDPWVVWSVGLAEGASYDVKGFKVQVRYWDIR